jgi:hypothetical protein
MVLSMRSRRAFARSPWPFALALVLSCSNGVPADRGTDAYMQVSGARFVRGPMPAGEMSGPGVAAVTLVNNEIWPGMQNDPIGGTLDHTATAAALGLQGDVGYWIVGAGVPNVATPDSPSFAASAQFSLGIVPGTYTLVVQSVDETGTFGLPTTQILTEEDSPLNPPAKGALVVTLTWDTEANLALHVVDPNGAEIYWGNQSSQPPFSFTQADGGSYGYIDYDSNANCVIDGLRREDAIWPNAPPPGTYIVRVDTPSLCAAADAYWDVTVLLAGKKVAEAHGVALAADTMGTHGLGSGVLALKFVAP